MPASLVGNTFVVYFEVLPTTQVCRQNKANQRDLAVIHCLLFVNLLTNNHGKKPRLLELTPVLSAGRLEEPSRMCHPFLCCVLRGSGHVLCDAQVSITSPSNNSKVQVQHKRHVEYSTCLYRIKGADFSPWYTFFVFFLKWKQANMSPLKMIQVAIMKWVEPGRIVPLLRMIMERKWSYYSLGCCYIRDQRAFELEGNLDIIYIQFKYFLLHTGNSFRLRSQKICIPVQVLTNFLNHPD